MKRRSTYIDQKYSAIFFLNFFFRISAQSKRNILIFINFHNLFSHLDMVILISEHFHYITVWKTTQENSV